MKKLLLASVAALGLASVVALAGVNFVQEDDGDFCFSFDFSTNIKSWCWQSDGDLVIDDGTTDSPSITLQDGTDETTVITKLDSADTTVTIQAADSLRVATGNLRVGNGTPAQTLNGEDAYIEGVLEVDGTAQFDGLTIFTGILRDNLVVSVPLQQQCKVGATAGWVVTASTDKQHATLPASQTSSTLVCPLPDLPVGATVTAVSVAGQVESAGGNVTLVMSFRKQTNAAADNTDAEIATDNVGTLTADTKVTSAELGVTGTSEIIASDESLYVLLTGTTAASTDIDLTHLIVSYTTG